MADIWKEFNHIIGIDPTELDNASTRQDVVPTEVTDVDDGDNNADRVYYDMNGRRLNAPIKGLNIVNGKKVMMK